MEFSNRKFINKISKKKLSMVIVEDVIYFNNSLGDISAVDINDGELTLATYLLKVI